MKIKDDCFNKENKQAIKLDLMDLLKQPSDKQLRPCPGCRFRFPDETSLTSTKYCSPTCKVAPKQMSSDPQSQPIEEKVIPLVYAIYTTRLMMPCWSCEGHTNAKGEVYKLPRVWFYSTSGFYPKMVAQYLCNLKGKHKITNPRQLAIQPYSQSMFSTTYSIEPADNLNCADYLYSLHDDIKIIGKMFRSSIHTLARDYLNKANKY